MRKWTTRSVAGSICTPPSIWVTPCGNYDTEVMNIVSSSGHHPARKPLSPNQLSLPFVNMVLIGMTLLSAPLTPLPRIGRCASPVAMEPQLDISAAFVCAFCFSPVVLGLHWGTEWNEARDRCTSAQKRFEMERLRLMCGEGEAHAQRITSTPLHR